MIDIHTIGAGGGSIARWDSGGAFRVGPQSAGAVPGPAAYGRGGSQPTVTDANVVLGRLDPDRFLGGVMKLDAAASQQVMQGFATELGISVAELVRRAIQRTLPPPGVAPWLRYAGFVECVNLGIRITKAAIVHVLAPGFEASDGWMERALRHFEQPQIGSVTPCVYDNGERDKILTAGLEYNVGGRRAVCRAIGVASESTRAAVGPLGQAAFYRKAALESLGGMPEAVGDTMADVDLALSLHRAGWRNVVEPTCHVLGTEIGGIPPAGVTAGLHSERLFWRHFGESNRLQALAAHCAAVLGDITALQFWKTPAQLLGRLIACCQFGHYRQYQQLIGAATKALQLDAASQTNAALTATAGAVRERDQQHRIDEPHSARPARRPQLHRTHR
jgi:hypothetical protein